MYVCIYQELISETLLSVTNVKCMYTMSCPIKVNRNALELKVHTYFYCNLDLLCVI